jgi:hypothetical protein
MLMLLAMATAFALPSVPDQDLQTMRGGMALPDGLTVNLGVDIQTMINGELALHTSYQSDGPNAGIRVNAGAGGTSTISTDDQGTTTRYSLPDFAVQQMLGSQIGAIVSNSADNRTIETTATLSATVSGVDVSRLTAGFALDRIIAPGIR